MLWTFLVSGYDTLANLVQFSAALAATWASIAFAGCFPYTRPQGIFAALAWATFPLVILEATSVQNDLVISLFILIACGFPFDGFQRETPMLEYLAWPSG